MRPGLLEHAPGEAELERLYYELARLGAPAVGRRRPWPYAPDGPESLLALAGEMLRFDARLLTVLLQLVLARWHALNPLELRRRMEAMRWPQALLVVFEFSLLADADPELRRFVDYLGSGWPRVEPVERFFLDTEKPGSRTAARRLGRNLKPYARWGFIGVERPIADPATRRTVGRYEARTRRAILAELLGRQTEITVAEYLDAVDHVVSRQQAIIDLRRSGRLKRVGRGRGARWRVKPGGRPPAGAVANPRRAPDR